MEKHKLERYADIQPLVRKEIEVVANSIFDKRLNDSEYGVKQPPYHVHNGTDAPLISEDHVRLTEKLTTQLVALNTGGDSITETLTLTNVPNVSRISFHGFAANNAVGSATIRATISGEVIFGRCYVFTGTAPTVTVTTEGPGTPFVQSCNSILVDQASINNTRVVTSPKISSVSGGVAELVLTNYTNNSLVFEYTLGSEWQLNGILIIE